MTEEIKEILDNFEKYEARYKLHNETQFIITHREIEPLLDYITNLQQENEKLKFDIRYWENKWQNTRFANNQVKVLQDTIIKSANNTNRAMEQTEIYKSRCVKAIKSINIVEDIIKKQPDVFGNGDMWVLKRLNGFKYILQGSDEK